MRKKVVVSSWVREGEHKGEHGEGHDAGVRVAGSKAGGTSGAVHVREKVQTCVLLETEEERGR